MRKNSNWGIPHRAMAIDLCSGLICLTCQALQGRTPALDNIAVIVPSCNKNNQTVILLVQRIYTSIYPVHTLEFV